MVKASHLFYVQKVFGFKVNSGTLDRTVFIKGPTVTHIGFHCKCYWFRLLKGKENKNINDIQCCMCQYTSSLPFSFSLKISLGSIDLYESTRRLNPSVEEHPLSINMIQLFTWCASGTEGEFIDKHWPLTPGHSPWPSLEAAEPGARLHAETPPGPPPGTGRNPRVD